MQRLINWLYFAFFGLRIRNQEQHIADLEQLLSDLLDDREALEDDINLVTERLLDAMITRDRQSLKRAWNHKVHTPVPTLN